MKRIYKTHEIADAVGVHTNSVRLYEDWGYIAPVLRNEHNYRQYTKEHLKQMKFARIALPGPFPLNSHLVHELVCAYAKGKFQEAKVLAESYLKLVIQEIEHAKRALTIIDKWFTSQTGDCTIPILTTRINVSKFLGVTVDALRTWERNGLYEINRNSKGKLTFTQWDLEKIQIIRILRNSGFNIHSLHALFSTDEKLNKKPSEILMLPNENGDIFYITDRYMEYLYSHEKRSKKLLKILKKEITG
jgi:DNA-binding transcriptional MerR regulator